MTQIDAPYWHPYCGRVAWVDTDASGRIHFTAVFRWVEAAEHDLLRSIGCVSPRGFPRVNVQATYRAPMRFNDEFQVSLGVSKVGRTSIGYAWEIRCREELTVEGSHLAVYVGDGDRATPLPAQLRDELQKILH